MPSTSSQSAPSSSGVQRRASSRAPKPTAKALSMATTTAQSKEEEEVEECSRPTNRVREPARNKENRDKAPEYTIQAIYKLVKQLVLENRELRNSLKEVKADVLELTKAQDEKLELLQTEIVELHAIVEKAQLPTTPGTSYTSVTSRGASSTSGGISIGGGSSQNGRSRASNTEKIRLVVDTSREPTNW